MMDAPIDAGRRVSTSPRPTAGFDPELEALLRAERRRQDDFIELMASENYASAAVLAVQASVASNKYAEGYVGDRDYAGCEEVDRIERLAVARAKRLFRADYANVQPHSGSQANEAAFAALLQPGDTILSMDMAHGGHFSHGAATHVSGRIYRAAHYGLDPRTERFDYDAIARLALQLRPRLVVAGCATYSRRVDWAAFRRIADSVGASLMVDMAHIAGLVAAGEHASPVPFADVVTSTTNKTLRGPRGGLILARKETELTKRLDAAVYPGVQGGALMHVIAAKAVAFREAMGAEFRRYQGRVRANAAAMADRMATRGFHVVSGGTDNHLFLVDLGTRGISGRAAERALHRAGIVVNKEGGEGAPRSPFFTTGIRIGSAPMTTRGFGIREARRTADLVCDVIENVDDEATIARVAAAARALCRRFPVYASRRRR